VDDVKLRQKHVKPPIIHVKLREKHVKLPKKHVKLRQKHVKPPIKHVKKGGEKAKYMSLAMSGGGWRINAPFEAVGKRISIRTSSLFMADG